MTSMVPVRSSTLVKAIMLLDFVVIMRFLTTAHTIRLSLIHIFGYDTAMNTALEMIDKLRDTTQRHDRCSVCLLYRSRCV